MEETILNIYGARYNKETDRVNITLVGGKGENRKFYTISLKANTLETRILAEVDEADDEVSIAIPLLKPNKKASKKKDAFDEADELPF